MNKYIKLLAISFLISCGSKSDEQYQDKIGIEIKDTLSINESAKLLIALSNNLNSLENQKKYFNFFPNNFTEFNDIFGYKEIPDSFYDTIDLKDFGKIDHSQFNGPLYENSGIYIDIFFQKLKINTRDRVKKNIDICLFAKWDADGVNMYQMYLQDDFISLLNIYSVELENKTNEEILSVWHFFYDGPHPENYQKDYEELYKRYKNKNPRIAKLMKQSYEKLLENGCQGH
jgi:hypothetical protein